MADKIFENNQVSIVGEIVSDFRFGSLTVEYQEKYLQVL